MEASSTEQWGWENFFTSLGSFIESSERQYEGGANHQYSEYAIARLAMCSRNVAAIKEHIETAFDVSSSEDQQAFTSLLTQLNELLLILNALLEKWQLHQDELEQRIIVIRHLLNMTFSHPLAVLNFIFQENS